MNETIDTFADRVAAIRKTTDDLRALVAEAIDLHNLEVCEQALARVLDAYGGLANGLIELAAERVAAAGGMFDDLETRA
jgi:hypothetical protein